MAKHGFLQNKDSALIRLRKVEASLQEVALYTATTAEVVEALASILGVSQKDLHERVEMLQAARSERKKAENLAKMVSDGSVEETSSAVSDKTVFVVVQRLGGETLTHLSVNNLTPEVLELLTGKTEGFQFTLPGIEEGLVLHKVYNLTEPKPDVQPEVTEPAVIPTVFAVEGEQEVSAGG